MVYLFWKTIPRRTEEVKVKEKRNKVEEKTNRVVYFQADSHSGDLGLDTMGIFAQTSHHCRRHRITVCQRQRKRSPYPLTLVPPFVKGHQRLGTKGSYMTKNVQMVSPKSSGSLWQKSLLQKKARGNRYLSLLLLSYICRKLFPTMTEEY